MQPGVRRLPLLAQLLPRQPRRRLDHVGVGRHAARAVGPPAEPAVEQADGAVEQATLRLSQLRLG